MRAYLTVAGMALGLVALWAALAPLLALGRWFSSAASTIGCHHRQPADARVSDAASGRLAAALNDHQAHGHHDEQRDQRGQDHDQHDGHSAAPLAGPHERCQTDRAGASPDRMGQGDPATRPQPARDLASAQPTPRRSHAALADDGTATRCLTRPQRTANPQRSGFEKPSHQP
jgi:hypothetical protein